MDKNMLNLFTDPVKWAEAFLRNPRDREEPLKLRSYQKDVLSNTRKYKNMVLRWGRRMGKSVILCADTLFWASAYPLASMIEGKTKKQKPYKILIATPYETQIKMLWATYQALIADSPLLREQVKKIRTSDVHLIEFDNGSRIEGYTIGISSSNQGTSLRGMSADMLFLDELDAIPGEIVTQVLMPIWTTHEDCRLRVCSTPMGKRELFYEWCTKAAELGWYHTHHASWHPDNENWMSIEQAKQRGIPITESSEFQVRAITPGDVFNREYGAEFGEELGGVYKHTFINRSLVKYGRNIDVQDPDKFDPQFPQNPEHKYIMGVDWNSYVNGGQIVILEYCTTPTIMQFFDDEKNEDVLVDFTGKYRVFYRVGIKSKSATQRMTRFEIIRLMNQYKIDYLYVDYGAGDTNIEELTLYGREHPELQLHQKLRVIDSGAVVEHYDHIAQRKVKKRNKSLMVNFSAVALENGSIVLPKEEDQTTRLVGQIRGYQIKHVTSRGEFAYEGEDHILDAFNLAMYGFQQNYGYLLTSRVIQYAIPTSDPRINDYPIRAQTINTPMRANRVIRDPERTPTFESPRRIEVPSFGRRANLGGSRSTLGFGRGAFNGR